MSVGPSAKPIADRLAERTLGLVGIGSESRKEQPVLDAIRTAVRLDAFEVLDDGDSVLFLGPRVRRVDAPFVVLAGHVDTVPVGGASMPGSRDEEGIAGRGASDMKAGLAVMVELAGVVAMDPGAGDLDVGFLFFGREELPIAESALLPMFDRCPAAATIDLAVVMEPTDNAIEVGCLGNLNARVIVGGAAAHSARPWLGDNAIHTAIAALAPIADLPDRDVEIDGLVFREVVSVTTIEGGTPPTSSPIGSRPA